jgi:hypothetical protein
MEDVGHRPVMGEVVCDTIKIYMCKLDLIPEGKQTVFNCEHHVYDPNFKGK